MGILEEQITRTLLPGMHVPQPLRALFGWMEQNDLYVDRPTGERVGFLFPQVELRESWTETQRRGGTNIEFSAEGNSNLNYWFGHERPEVLNRLCVFARTGGEGSMAAFWLAPNGAQRIVHLGSGSGSLMVCTLAEDPADFVRLLAIGYDEICWGDGFSVPPPTSGSFVVHPNEKYRQWVSTTFPGGIPLTALEIVKHPDDLGDTDSADPFNQWVSKNLAA